jgi:hypothetical protein
MSEAGRLADRTTGSAEARARRAPRPATLAWAVLFALLAAALVPLSLVARPSPLVNGGESLPAILFGVVGLVCLVLGLLVPSDAPPPSARWPTS